MGSSGRLAGIETITEHIPQQAICRIEYLVHKITKSHNVTSPDFCESYFDGILCWPKIQSGLLQALVCPMTINGIPMDNTCNPLPLPLPSPTPFPTHRIGDNASRMCFPNGTWAERANYSGCIPTLPLQSKSPIPHIHLEIMYVLYWIGYCVSLFFLSLALIIFIHYKQLWCLRNLIHTNLLLCFALHNVTWIAYSLIGHEILAKHDSDLHYCIIPTTILKYFIAAGFFWMFVEGAFLFITIMFSFYSQRITFLPCALVGWGIPAILIAITSIIKTQQTGKPDCWNEQFQLDYIFIGPVLAILLVNLLFLVAIMYVIVMKLQLTVRAEAERYKKVCKALLILCPLLGINYVLVLVQPSKPLWLNLTFYYYITIMTSTQGTLVAIFFCFRNNEVREAVRGKWRHWLDARGGSDNQLYLKLLPASLLPPAPSPRTHHSTPSLSPDLAHPSVHL